MNEYQGWMTQEGQGTGPVARAWATSLCCVALFWGLPVFAQEDSVSVPVAECASDDAGEVAACEQREAAMLELSEARRELAEAAKNLARIERTLVKDAVRIRAQEAARVAAHERVIVHRDQQGEIERRIIIRHDGGTSDEEIEWVMDDDSTHKPAKPMLPQSPKPPVPRLGIMLGNVGEGNVVMGLTKGGGAESAGLAAGDQLISVNDMALSTDVSVTDALHGVAPGEVVPVVVLRDAEEVTIDVVTSDPATLAGHGENVFAFHIEDIDGGAMAIEIAGLEDELANIEREFIFTMQPEIERQAVMQLPGLYALGDRSELTANHPGLEQYFGTGEGVIVLRIDADNELGLADGDVIMEVDDTAVARPTDVARQLLSKEQGSAIELLVMREGNAERISGMIPEKALP